MTTHVGTHIDALGHASRGNTLYNGLTVDETVDDFGLTELGIEHLPPMITRGACWTYLVRTVRCDRVTL